MVDLFMSSTLRTASTKFSRLFFRSAIRAVFKPDLKTSLTAIGQHKHFTLALPEVCQVVLSESLGRWDEEVGVEPVDVAADGVAGLGAAEHAHHRDGAALGAGHAGEGSA